MPTTANRLLEVENLNVAFTMYQGALTQGRLQVITDLSIRVDAGEILAIVGSSGSGKSLLAHAILGILPENASVGGSMRYRGVPMTPEVQARLRDGSIALVPQSVSCLDPLMRVEKQAIGARRRTQTRKRLLEQTFARMGLDKAVGRMYPYQLSGGMARKVLFATAILQDAELIIADEPTPGMPLAQAREALRILREFADAGKGVVLITHDIDLALSCADTLAVFYAGTVLERMPAADFEAGIGALRHPYSRALWAALPQNGFAPIAGLQPYAGEMPKGCPFAPRCAMGDARCARELPQMTPLRGGQVRCFHAT